jgi:hypothetical protein
MASQSPQVLDFIIDLKPNKTAFAFVAINDDLLLEWLDESKESVVVQTRRRSDGFGLRIR